MPYEIHAYCTGKKTPTVGDLLAHLRDNDDGPGFIAEAPETEAKELDSSSWKEVFLRYGRKPSGRKKPEMESLALGCYRNTGPKSMCAEMAAEKIEKIAGYKDSAGKKRVLDCLGKVRFVIWCRVDNDVDRERASPVLDLLASLLYKHGAVFDLEDEGFLAGSDTPLCGWCANDE